MATNPKLILWDLDGTLCQHNEAFFRLAPEAVAAAALDFDIPMKPKKALQLAQDNFKGQRESIMAFVKQFNLEEKEVFSRYYHHLDPDFITSSTELVTAIRNLTIHTSCGVLTQAPESWAIKALERLELTPYFNKDLIIGHTCLNGARKTEKECSDHLSRILQEQHYSRQDVVLVDDKLKVLMTLGSCIGTRIWLQSQPGQVLPPDGILTATTPLEVIRLLENTAIAEHGT